MVNVTNAIAFWNYMTTQFIQLYTKKEKKPFILETNHFLGVARIRQLRVDEKSCLVEMVLRQFITNCYGFFRTATMDTKPFGPGTSTAWVYSPPEVTKSPSYRGHFGTYGGGGYYADIPRDYFGAMRLFTELKTKDWIDRQTRFVFVHVCTFNSNTNDFWVIQLNFEFAPIGQILTSARAFWLQTIDAADRYSYFLTACRIFFVGYTIGASIGHVLYIIQLGRSYLLYLGHYIEFASLLLSWLFICSDSIYWYHVQIPFQEAGPSAHYCAHLQSSRDRIEITLITGSMALFLSVVLFLEFLDFGGSSPLVLTLLSSFCDILSFSAVFLLTLFVFSVASYQLFGQYVESMRGTAHAFFTLFNAVLRSFDYHSLLEASRTFAPMFFILFTFLFIFVLCNLFVVILNDTYFDVRSKHIQSIGIYNFPSFLRHGFSNIARKLHLPECRKNPPPRGLSYQCVRSLFHNAWVHWPEMWSFFNRKRVKEAAMVNRIDEICVANVPRLKFGYLKEAYWEDFERLLWRMSVIRGNMYAADNFVAPLVNSDVPGYMRRKLVQEKEQQKRGF